MESYGPRKLLYTGLQTMNNVDKSTKTVMYKNVRNYSKAMYLGQH